MKRQTNKKTKKTNRKTKKRGGELDKAALTKVRANLQSKQQQQNLVKRLMFACKNPDNCLALGPYDTAIKAFFNDFRNFQYVDLAQIRRIGASKNGIILEIPFEKHGYKAYTVLKCATSEEADNLAYEYIVGKYFINQYLKRLPTFVETYDCYLFKDLTKWEDMTNHTDSIQTKYKSMLDIFELYHLSEDTIENIVDSCKYNKRIAVLIQHFDSVISFYDTCTSYYDDVKYDIPNILYQVYFALTMLGNNYTHYDLHSNNVLLYKPYDGKQYIRMRYHSTNKQVYEFPSEYVPKIIDYGRNYFNTGTLNSSDILSKICDNNPSCEPNCGGEYGYGVIRGTFANPSSTREDFYWITPNKSNISHDLQLATFTQKYLQKNGLKTKLVYKQQFGTPSQQSQIPKRSFPFGKKKITEIRNIFDLVKELETILPKWNKTKTIKKYNVDWTCVAEMDVYSDGREYTYTALKTAT